MSHPKLSRSALVVTTTPHLPREYGNRNRVFQSISFLKSFGYTVSCLLYPFDEEWESTVPDYYTDLVASFDYFAVIPNSKVLHQGATQGPHHTIDEWWDDNIGRQLAWLFQRKKFDLLYVNYTFLSKAFEFAPKKVFRVLDTHDVFTGRRETFERFGVPPEFFYTNADEEKLAFDRADAVIAIKASEAELLRNLTGKPIITIPYWDNQSTGVPFELQVDRPAFSHTWPLRLGFIGAQNSVNVINMQRFLKKMARFIPFYDAPIEISIAGNVCRQIHDDLPFVKKLGRVPLLSDFYRNVDAVVAPLEFSTGIKIKVGEALAWGLPVLATQNASDGFQTFHSTQCEPSVDALCRSLVRLAFNEIPYKQLVIAGRSAARSAFKAQEMGFKALRRTLRKASRQILFITDRPFWHRQTYIDELTAQAIEYVSKIATTTVISLSSEEPPANLTSQTRKYIGMHSAFEFKEWLSEALAFFEPMGFISHLLTHDVVTLRLSLKSLSTPLWTMNVRSGYRNGKASVYFDNGMPSGSFIVSPLRHLPIKWTKKPKVGVSVLLPDQLTEWEALLVDFLATQCYAKDLDLRQISMPRYAEFDSLFFSNCVENLSDRLVVIRRDVSAELFLLQTAQYLRVRTLIVSSDSLCPDVCIDGMPSLTASISAFLDGSSGGFYAAGSNIGWRLLKAEMENAPHLQIEENIQDAL